MKYLLFFLFLIIVSCNNFDVNYIKDNVWYWDSGYVNGAKTLIFVEHNDVIIKHNMIYANGSPMYKIIRVNKKQNEMYLQSMTSDSMGLFINVDEDN
jgi:hypothetical protein